MKRYQRDILICLVVALTTIGVVYHFLQRMHNEQVVHHTEIYAILDESSDGVLVIHRPALFAQLMLKDSIRRNTFHHFIPDHFLSLLPYFPDNETIHFSFHPQGIVCYAKLDQRKAIQLEKRVLQPILGGDFPAQTVAWKQVNCRYYPTHQNGYIGCYQYDNIWIASNSKHLLEQTLQRQLTGQTPSLTPFQQAFATLDQQSVANIMLPTESLHMELTLPDSTQWHLPTGWLTADLFIESQQLCCIGSWPYQAQLDSIYQPFADTLASRLSDLIPSLQYQTQVDPGEERVYWTICYH